MNPINTNRNRDNGPSAGDAGGDKEETGCLFCYRPVLLNLEKSYSIDELEERRKWVNNLSEFRQLDVVLPEKMTMAMIPFCEDCEQLIERVSWLWEELGETFQRIEKNFSEGELNKSGGSSVFNLNGSALEQEKWTVLKDKILEGKSGRK